MKATTGNRKSLRAPLLLAALCWGSRRRRSGCIIEVGPRSSVTPASDVPWPLERKSRAAARDLRQRGRVHCRGFRQRGRRFEVDCLAAQTLGHRGDPAGRRGRLHHRDVSLLDASAGRGPSDADPDRAAPNRLRDSRRPTRPCSQLRSAATSRRDDIRPLRCRSGLCLSVLIAGRRTAGRAAAPTEGSYQAGVAVRRRPDGVRDRRSCAAAAARTAWTGFTSTGGSTEGDGEDIVAVCAAGRDRPQAARRALEPGGSPGRRARAARSTSLTRCDRRRRDHRGRGGRTCFRSWCWQRRGQQCGDDIDNDR